MMSGESDEHSIAAESFPKQLANVHFTMMSHLGRTRVAKVGIVRPDDRFRLPASVEMCDQIFDGLYHVPVAQVPRRCAPAKHRPVILLSIFYQPRVLFREKEFLCGYFAIAA